MRSFVARIFGHGSLFWTEGREHRTHKQTLLPFFSHDSISRMTSDIQAASEKLVDSLREYIDVHQTTSASADVCVNHFTWKAMLDIIGSVAFGHDFRFGSSDEAKAIHGSFEDIAALDGSMAGFMGPLLLRALPIIADLPIKALDAPGETRRTIRRLAKALVEEHRKLAEGVERQERDMLSTMITVLHDEDLGGLLDDVGATVHFPQMPAKLIGLPTSF